MNDRVYYVLEGKGQFVFDEGAIPVESTDVVVVPKGTPYDYRGKIRMFLVHVPAFDEAFEFKME